MPKDKKMPIRTINNVVKYVSTEIQEPITATSSTLQANETHQLYSLMQGPTSILKVKMSINEAKSNRSRSADAVRAIFDLPENETKRILLTIKSFTRKTATMKPKEQPLIKQPLKETPPCLLYTHI